tara:strand:+ start:64 stop:504 length:441 start_codon:yes stop_codon:yes gene_type:complete
MVFSEVIEEIIVALIPEKVRKIIGSILLIFGTVVFLWGWWILESDSGLGGIGGLIAVFVGGSSIGLGLYFQMFWWDPFFSDFEQEDDISPESIMKNQKQQIHCPSCNQKLNIPLIYSGKISCPACGIYIALDEGIIQAEGLPSVHS